MPNMQHISEKLLGILKEGVAFHLHNLQQWEEIRKPRALGAVGQGGWGPGRKLGDLSRRSEE